MRHERLERHSFPDSNPLRKWKEVFSFWKTTRNILVIFVARYMPLGPKNSLIRKVGVNIEGDVALGIEATLDVFRPDLISIGQGTTIGYDTTVLTHETTQDEIRVGPVDIGENVLIGANSTVLPGVTIGDNAKISAHSLVDRDVKKGEFVGGVPIQNLSDKGE